MVLSGGSLFGLDAAGGVVNYLREQGIGFKIGAATIPVASQAITFDLLNGGDKNWGRKPPYWDLGWAAAETASAGAFPLGTQGGGYGATTATLKGGLGSASMTTRSGFTVGAIAVVNAVGTLPPSATARISGPRPTRRGHEFGGLGLPASMPSDALALRMKGGAPPSTTIALVVTDAILTKSQAKRLAIMADDGLARAIRPAHAPMDGDTVIAAAMLRKPLQNEAIDLTEIGLAAADCLARAIARGVYEATALPFAGALPVMARQIRRRPVMRWIAVASFAVIVAALILWQQSREQTISACLSSGGSWNGSACAPTPAAPSCSAICTDLDCQNRSARYGDGICEGVSPGHHLRQQAPCRQAPA